MGWHAETLILLAVAELPRLRWRVEAPDPAEHAQPPPLRWRETQILLTVTEPPPPRWRETQILLTVTEPPPPR